MAAGATWRSDIGRRSCHDGDMRSRSLQRSLLSAVATLVLAIAAVAVGAGIASAGGDWAQSVLDRYEAGDQVTMVGYTGSGAYGGPDDGPYYGYLSALVDEHDREMIEDFVPVALGEIAQLSLRDLSPSGMEVLLLTSGICQ